ncbi:MAG: FixH family protein [Roseibium sp.]
MTMAQPNSKDPKAITGKTVLVWLLAFFAVIFAANAVFIYLAVGSFPGVVVESSYEAGQAYNEEIAAAKEQANLNWQISSELVRAGENGARLMVSAADGQGTPLYGIEIHATLKHPAQVNSDIEIILKADGGGRYVSEIDSLPAGNWNLVLEIDQDSERKFKSENRLFVKD